MIALQNMRMACDSTYLLDQTTDHGAKADELVTVLDEVFQDPDARIGSMPISMGRSRGGDARA